MDELTERFQYYKEHKTVKEQKKFHLDAIIRLRNKLLLLEDDSLHAPFTELLNILEKEEHTRSLNKEYQKIWTNIKVLVKEKHGLVEKGEIQGQYMALGISFGLLVGVVFMTVNKAFIGIGLPIGVALGLSLGSSKEKAMEEKGLIF